MGIMCHLYLQTVGSISRNGPKVRRVVKDARLTNDRRALRGWPSPDGLLSWITKASTANDELENTSYDCHVIPMV